MNLDSRSASDLLSIKREFKRYEENKTSPRLGIQSKISVFFDCVRRRLEYIVENEFNKILSSKEKYSFFSKIVDMMAGTLNTFYPCFEAIQRREIDNVNAIDLWAMEPQCEA